MITRASLRQDVRDKMGDVDGLVWSDDDINLHLLNGYQAIAQGQDVFFDLVYLEDLPRAASICYAWEQSFLARVRQTICTEESTLFGYTQPWEQIFVTRNGWTDTGWCDYTAAWEATTGVPTDSILVSGFCKRGPGNHTNSFAEETAALATLGLQATWILKTTRYGGEFNDIANYTATFELALATDVADERTWRGPAVCSHVWEVTEGFLVRAGCDQSIPATADLPKTLTQLNRATWDQRGIDIFSPRQMQNVDARYELTAGEVYGLMWQKDGVRTVRKIRVPAAWSDYVLPVNDVVGIMRNCAALSGDTVVGGYGLPRRLPGHHPIGPFQTGLPRRPFLEGKNVRIEHFRQGRPFDDDRVACELPDRYAVYLRDYAQAKLYAHAGAGQDLALAAHYESRWARDLARIQRRRELMNREKTIVLGGEYRGLARRPPRPSLPWPYGREVK